MIDGITQYGPVKSPHDVYGFRVPGFAVHPSGLT